MKKLNKEISLATEFKKWYTKNKKFAYNSSANSFYYDVLYELLIIQEGLCAYTEFRLIDEVSLKELKRGFVNGKYNKSFKPDVPAQLEHFNKLQKTVSGWDWNNFFAVYTDINLKKNHLENTHGINNILKPDAPDYNPTKYLEYDKDLHLFYPNLGLSKANREKVNKMIVVLGLNNGFIKLKRKEYLNTIKTLEKYTEETQAIHQFHTAHSMIRSR